MPETKKSRLVPEVDFAKDGKQTGFIRLFHSTHDSAYGFLPIPIVVVKNGEGPTAFFSSGNHGDEYEGPVALSKLANTIDIQNVNGRIIIVPFMNTPAFLAATRTSPIDHGNMNRSFPGVPNGTVTQKIADYFNAKLSQIKVAGFSIPYVPSDRDCVWAQYTLMVPNRADFQKKMQELGVPTVVHYPRIMPDQPWYKKNTVLKK